MPETVEWPFVGREREVEQLRSRLVRGGAVLVGAAGVGKTQLAGQVLLKLHRSRYAVQRASGSEAVADLPLGAFATVLPEGAVEAGAPVVLGRAAEALQQRAGRRRLVLAVDDVNLLDRLSAALVEQLVRHHGARLLATLRTGSTSAVVDTLLRDDQLDRFDVGGLSFGEVGELLERALHGLVDRRTIGRLYDVSAGNPFLLREIVRAGLDSGTLVRTGELWSWSGTLVVGERLPDVLGRELDRLTPAEHAAMELLALGEPLGLELFRKLIPPDALENLDAQQLVRLERSGLRVDARLAHPLYGELLRAGCSPLRAGRIRRELADAVRRTGARRHTDLLRMAVWLADADAEAPEQFWLEAGRQAWAMLDVSLARRFAERAAAASGGVEAMLQLARAAGLGPDPEAADEMLGALTESVAGTERQVIGALRIFNLIVACARGRSARALVAELLAEATRPADQARLLMLDAFAQILAGQVAEGSRALDSLRTRGSADEATTAQVLYLVALTGAYAGTPKGAWSAIEQSADLIERTAAEVPWCKEAIDQARVLALVLGGAPAAAEAIVGPYLTAARVIDPMRVIWSWMQAAVARRAGRIQDASRWATESVALARQLGRPSPWADGAFAERAHALALLGRPDEAEAALADASPYLLESWRLNHWWIDAARPWVLAARGEVEAAATLAIALAQEAAETGTSAFELVLLHDAARLGGASRVVDRLHALSVRLEGPLSVLCADHARGLTESDAARLTTVAAGFEEAGLQLLAAEAWSQAASAARRTGADSAAREAVVRASALAARCQGASTPALVDLLAFGELTRREREIVRLAVSGLSNQQIAARLSLSQRTVENHLYAAYGKLGVSGREGLLDRLDLFDGQA